MKTRSELLQEAWVCLNHVSMLMRRCYQRNLSHCNVTVQLLAAEETDASFGRRWRPTTELKE